MTEQQSLNDYVLVVDDDDDLRAIIGLVLENQGFAVRDARDGQEALHCIEDHAPQLAILDFELPDTNGGVLALRLRQQLGVQLPVIVISGSAIRDVLPSLHNIVFLAKPFDIDELLMAVRSGLKQSPP